MNHKTISVQLEGADAQLFPSHAYLNPIKQKIESIWDVDPLRLYADSYFPRDVGHPIYSSNTKSECVVDIIFSLQESISSRHLNMWLVPHQYSYAQHSLQVGSMEISPLEHDLRTAAEQLLKFTLSRMK
jgi:hypothetical protein